MGPALLAATPEENLRAVSPMGLFDHVPLVLVLVPIVLMVCDVLYKWAMFKSPPYDSVADIALAALTFSAAPRLTRMLGPAATPGGSFSLPAFVWFCAPVPSVAAMPILDLI